jgi:hypothetical protein
MPFFLAHQGGWDEILYLAVPAVGVIFWVRWAEKRARARSGDRETEPPTTIADDSDPARGDRET